MPEEPVCLASDWEPDRGFLEALEHRLQGDGQSTYLVWPQNLEETRAAVARGALGFSYLVDRASNTSPEFLALTAALARATVPCLDRPEAMSWAADKATMHLEFLEAGINVPHTVILDPLTKRVQLREASEAIAAVGTPFVAKPANTTGGGVGVLDQATSWQDVERVRALFPSDKYLIQQRVYPLEHDGRRFWFRGFYACGASYWCWWDERSHVYETLTGEQRERYGLHGLESILRSIVGVCALNLFSSEMVKTGEGRMVVVDYVNETPDLRRQSCFPDGVPDEIVASIVEDVALHVRREIRTP